jgi:hypothetical protein
MKFPLIKTHTTMNRFKLNFSIALILLIPFSAFYGQEEEEESQDGGSAAEAAVTGSASQPTTGASGAIESNPLVFAVRSGVDLQQALSLGLTAIREMASSGSDNFVSEVNSVAKINAAGGSIDFSLIDVLSDLDLSDDVYSATMTVGSLYTTTSASLSTTYQEALVQAATLANTLLVDRTITTVSDIPTTIGVSELASTGYNVALLELLNSYGAIGSNGSALLDSVLGDSRTLDGSISNLSSTSNYLTYLATLTGSRTFGELDAESTVLSVPLSNVNLAPGANIILGSATSSSSIDVSEPLATATSTSDRKIAIIGAAKDITVSGDVTFTNSNDAEDHALVLGSADDFMVNGKDITYTGSNLALGAGGTDADSMYLVNTTITTGGNLAAGTLGTLNISNADFVVGNANSATSDPDNVYLYANDLIQVNGLNFSGSRLDDVYMEAITINLKDVNFPSTAEVMLRSNDGSLHFDTYSKPVVGGVNLTDVTHGAINGGQALQASDFDGTTGGHIDSVGVLGNGIPAISVRAQ